MKTLSPPTKLDKIRWLDYALRKTNIRLLKLALFPVPPTGMEEAMWGEELM